MDPSFFLCCFSQQNFYRFIESDFFRTFCYFDPLWFWNAMITFQGTNISPKNGILKMIFRTSQGGICIHPLEGIFSRPSGWEKPLRFVFGSALHSSSLGAITESRAFVWSGVDAWWTRTGSFGLGVKVWRWCCW